MKSARFLNFTRNFHSTLKLEPHYDAIVVGGGHNGLVAAAYLARKQLRVCVLERRPLVGGAAVTEEIVPDFKFSRASYLLSLFRPVVLNDLDLKRHGLRYHIKDPSSFTPIRGSNKSLILGSDPKFNQEQIAQFSTKDATKFEEYEKNMGKIVRALEPLMDKAPPDWDNLTRFQEWGHLWHLWKAVSPLGIKGMMDLSQLLTAPISKVLDQWFESEPLKATLATDAVIGSGSSPFLPATGYVLLHHVMGELDGCQGAWAIVQGGMGAVSQAICSAAEEAGAQIFTDTTVEKLLVEDGRVQGVQLAGGRQVDAGVVLSNATPAVTFLELTPQGTLPADFITAIKAIDYTSPATKINVALDSLPNFTAIPNKVDGSASPHHQTTIHFNCESMALLHRAYVDYLTGHWSKHPIIEMTIPTSVDPTMAPKGCHVAHLFTQMTPYKLSDRPWDEAAKQQYAHHVFSEIECYSPGFTKSVVGFEVLTPPDLEAIFSLTGGNIFHGAISLDQLYWSRPVTQMPSYRSPIKGLYLCGSGAHPGGGVTGAPGRLAALQVIKEAK